MLSVHPPSDSYFRSVLHSPGGFAWWYADLTNDSGDGLVLIWALGLPFLPGMRRGNSPPGDRPALSLAVYERGRPTFYLLQEYPAGQGRLESSGSGTLGSSTFSVRREGGLVVDAQLDLTVPACRQRLRGRLTWRGASWPEQRPGGGGHVWNPLSFCAQGAAQLTFEDKTVELEGNGYVDSNFSDTPLHAQGIAAWSWGRVSFPDRTLVYYVLEPEAAGSRQDMLFEQRRGGSVCREISGQVELGDLRAGRFGLTSPRSVTLRCQHETIGIVLDHLVDDGPFYQRFLARACSDSGSKGEGVAEFVVPKLIDRPWQRPFVRMRTHCLGEPNSMWLPLFSGSTQGRGQRLLRSFTRWQRGDGRG